MFHPKRMGIPWRQLSIILIVIACCSKSFYSIAQTDTEFWFAVPWVTPGHAGDGPAYFRLTSIGNVADVTLDIPADPTFIPVTVNIPADGTTTLDISTFINNVWVNPNNTVLNRGVRIRSTSLITAYYEFRSTGNNPEIFSLKGGNALGNEFTIVSQNFWYNANYNPMPTNGFSIVATEDNTSITITPTKNMVGHPVGVPFTITLNEGQVYACAASSGLAADHLMGTKITSDKPIAVTVSDDSVKNDSYGNCADLIGDQMIPETIIGTEYLIMKGLLLNDDKLFIMAVDDDTEIFESGDTINPVATLQAGEMYVRNVAAPIFIESSKPTYAYHVTGVTCEVGSAVLPPLKCTGSQKVGFTRSFPGDFGLIVMVQVGGEDDFTLTGPSGAIPFPGSNFQAVPGTDWLVARVTFTTAQINAGDAYLMTNNSHLFHLGVMDGPGGNSGGNYGYFSNFAVTSAAGNTNSPISNPICEEDTLTLESVSYLNADYEWLGPNGFASNDESPQIPDARESMAGWYKVRVTVQGCPSEWDSVRVYIKRLPIIDSVVVDTPCVGEPITMNVYGTLFASFNWLLPDGTNHTGGVYNVGITDYNDSLTHQIYPTRTGCIGDTFSFDPVIKSYPTPRMVSVPELCDSIDHILSPVTYIDTNFYTWTITTADTLNLSDAQVQITTGGAGTINVTLEETQYGCTASFDTILTVNAPPLADLPVFTCNSTNTGYTFTFDASGGDGSYQEVTSLGSFSGTTFQSIEIENDSSFQVIFDDSKGCGPVFVDSTHYCPCTTESGTMDLNPITPCEGVTAVGIHQGDEFLDGDDILLFVLHTSDADSLGEILEWSSTPNFAFNSTIMEYEVTYFISAVAGNSIGSDQIDTTDRCLDVSFGVPVTFFKNPVVELIGGGVLCAGDTAIIEIEIESLGPVEVVYSWNSGANSTSFIGENDTTLVEVLHQSNVYDLVSAELNYGPGCAASISGQASFTVHQYPNPVIDKGDLEICDGASESYIVSVTTGSFDYEWIDVGSGAVLSNSNSLTLNDNIDREFYVVASTGGLCPTLSDTVGLIFHTPPSAEITGNGVICYGEFATPAISVLADTTARLVVNWGISETVTLITSTDTSATDVLFENTNFSLGSIAMDVFPFCPGTVSGLAEYRVLPKPEPVIPQPDTLLCADDSYTLTVGPQPMGLMFEWIDVLTGQTVSNTSTYTVANDVDRSLTVIASYEGGMCKAYTDTVNVRYELIRVSAHADPELIYFDEHTLISAQSDLALEYNWLYASGSNQNQSFTDSPNDITTYYITVKGEKCIAEDWIEVDAIQPIIIPNGFSPNGDQENELWYIKGLEDYPNADLQVFNRWGSVVYEHEGAYLDPWNGTNSKGEYLPVATYYYVLEANDRRKQKFKGFVTILK